MCTKFQVDWNSTSSKTTLTKNFNLKRDEGTDKQTDEQTDRRMDERTDPQTRKYNVPLLSSVRHKNENCSKHIPYT